MKKAIRVMIVEDHPEYREAVQHVLSKEADIKLVGLFGNANQALRSLQDPGEEMADVILLDLDLPGMPGFEAIPWIAQYAPEAKVIILSQSDREATVFLAIQRGVAGYLLKSSSMDEIKEGIRFVMQGGAVIEPTLAKYVLSELQRRKPVAEEEMKLTPREIDILTQVAEGLSQKEVAMHLKISVYTVAEHLSHIYEKLQVQNAPAAISKAFRSGILE
ncbi:MAG: response regulator transcription factor [Luteolibacter sp.]